MPLKKQFIEKGIQMMQIDEYLNEVLSNSGYAGSELQKTPLGLRITIKTARPGLVIGRKGIRIRELSDDLASKFGIDNPQIDVEPVENPDLNATIMAEALAFQIRKGLNYRRAAYSVMRRAIRGGARGVEVIISGKSTSQRARTQIFRSGIISKCGGPAIDGVDKGIAEIVMKSGTIGIRIKIMPLSYKMPDEIILKDPELKKKMDEINKKRKKVLDDTVEDANILIDKETSQILVDKEEIEESIFDEVEGETEIEEIEIEDLEKEEKGEKKKKKSKKEKSTKEKSPKKKKEKEAEDKEEVIDEATETKEDKKKVKKAKKKKEKEEKNSD